MWESGFNPRVEFVLPRSHLSNRRGCVQEICLNCLGYGDCAETVESTKTAWEFGTRTVWLPKNAAFQLFLLGASY